MNIAKADFSRFQYLTKERVEEILELFKLLGLDQFEHYHDATEFTKDIEQASNLQSDGIEYSVSTSTKGGK